LEVVRDASEKEGGHGHRPCEETRAPDFSLVRRMQLQKSAGSILASNKLARSALKKGGGTSERGPRRRGDWHEGVRDRVARNDVWCVELRRSETVQDRRRPRVA